MSRLASVLSVGLLNASTVVGLIITGQLIDKMHVSNVLLLSALVSTLAVFLLWGFATTAPVVYAFCIVFGAVAGGYTATWTGCATEVAKAREYELRMEGEEDEGKVEVAVVMGTMASGRGFGCFVGGPISEVILKLPKLHGKGVWGTKYGWLIIFVGSTMLLGRFGLFGRCGTRAKGVDGKGKGKQRKSLNEEENGTLIDG